MDGLRAGPAFDPLSSELYLKLHDAAPQACLMETLTWPRSLSLLLLAILQQI
jgi:hypothetical protein